MTMIRESIGCGDEISRLHGVPGTQDTESEERGWFAIFTVHQHERAVVEHLGVRGIESFFPTYEEQRRWKNRQKKTIILPLFPTYIFARLHRGDYPAVRESHSVLRIVGNSKGPIALSGQEVEFLRSDCIRSKIRPYNGLVIGRKVRISSGVMAGVEGVLVRRENGMKFVVSITLINQHAAVQISAADLESLA
jgi:transcription antitermination factor NusG